MIKITLIEDTRQQADKHKLKRAYFEAQGVKVMRSKLSIGDYANLKDLSVVIDTKKDIQEIIGNVTKDHDRFVRECEKAKENGIQLIILIEDRQVASINDLYCWYNPRLRYSPKATTGRTLAKILHKMQLKYGVKFLFCRKEDAGKQIVNLLF